MTPAAPDLAASAAVVTTELATTSMGFGHFIAQSDFVGKALLGILVAMSVISWALILIKGLTQVLRSKHSERFLAFFWNARSLDEVAGEIATHGVRDPFGHLTAHAMHARQHHAKYGAAKLEEAGSAQDFVTRTIKKVLDEETTRLENGLTTLATIGATAPFVGLFGTVWGVYHALVAIGMSGAGTLDKVAGPVGEALIMTGIGLAVAIPAVMAYNAITRSNRVLCAKLDAFAFELMTFLSMGSPLAEGSRSEAAPAVQPLRPAVQAA
jgi:biopolymer transport protein ExbB